MSPTEMFRRILDSAEPAEDANGSLRPTIPMDRALLCINCESIFEATGHQTCPSCGSATAWAIGRALNRTTSNATAVASSAAGGEITN